MNAELATVRMPKFELIKSGIFTVRSSKTGDHRTFKIELDSKGTRWVMLLTGPDNTEDYVSFARVVDGYVCVFYKHTGTQFHKLSNMLNKLPELIESGAVEIFHCGSCLICGRALTTPESVASGIGPVCSERM